MEHGRDGCVAQEALVCSALGEAQAWCSSLNLLGVTHTSGVPGDRTGSLDCFLIRNLGTVELENCVFKLPRGMGGPKGRTFEVLWEAAGAIAFENLPTSEH